MLFSCFTHFYLFFSWSAPKVAVISPPGCIIIPRSFKCSESMPCPSNFASRRNSTILLSDITAEICFFSVVTSNPRCFMYMLSCLQSRSVSRIVNNPTLEIAAINNKRHSNYIKWSNKNVTFLVGQSIGKAQTNFAAFHIPLLPHVSQQIVNFQTHWTKDVEKTKATKIHVQKSNMAATAL